jgi:hypothetical protein
MQKKAFLTVIDSLDNEKGCVAGNAYLAKFFKLSENRCSDVIGSLKKKLYISVEVDKSSGKSMRLIHVIALTDTTRRKRPVGVGGNAQWPLGGNAIPSNTEENNTVSKGEATAETPVADSDLKDFLFSFKGINPSYERLFPNISQRSAAQRLLATNGKEIMMEVMAVAPDFLSRKFAPRISTPIQLESKLGELLMFMKQEKRGDGKLKINVGNKYQKYG